MKDLLERPEDAPKFNEGELIFRNGNPYLVTGVSITVENGKPYYIYHVRRGHLKIGGKLSLPTNEATYAFSKEGVASAEEFIKDERQKAMDRIADLAKLEAFLAGDGEK